MASWDIISTLLGAVQFLLVVMVGAFGWMFKNYVNEFRRFKDEVLSDHMTRAQIEKKFDALDRRLDKTNELEIRLAVLERLGNSPPR